MEKLMDGGLRVPERAHVLDQPSKAARCRRRFQRSWFGSLVFLFLEIWPDPPCAHSRTTIERSTKCEWSSGASGTESADARAGTAAIPAVWFFRKRESAIYAIPGKKKRRRKLGVRRRGDVKHRDPCVPRNRYPISGGGKAAPHACCNAVWIHATVAIYNVEPAGEDGSNDARNVPIIEPSVRSKLQQWPAPCIVREAQAGQLRRGKADDKNNPQLREYRSRALIGA